MCPDRPAVTDDAILGGRLHLLQPKRGHRFGHDAILLAACIPAKRGEHAVEFGSGVGAASLALLARVRGIAVTMIETDPALAALAAQNIARNDFTPSARVVVLDRNMSVIEGSLGILPRRVLVSEEHAGNARRILQDAGLGHELRPDVP